jgi:N-acetylneuraminic acid mutarotase
VWTTTGSIFATDNGPNSVFGDASTSATTQAPVATAPDEVLAIVEGGYFGHPNRNRGRYDDRQNVYRAPTAAASLGNHTPPLAIVTESTNGIDEYRATTFGGTLRGSLLMQRWDNVLFRAALTPDGLAIASLTDVSGGPSGLDIVTGPGGAIIGADYTDNVVTVSLPVDSLPTMQAFDIFPWRARPDIVSEFVIGGVGFGANTSVTIGGAAATITSVSATRIRGLIPTRAMPTDELLDVVVQSQGLVSLIPAAFRYVLPRPLGNGSWKAGTTMPTALGEVAGGAINGVLYLVGSGSAATLAYDVGQRTWTGTLPPRPLQGDHHAAEVINGKLFLFGGLGNGSEGRVQIFNPATQSWTLGADMPFAAGSVSTAVIGGKVYVAGGIVDGNTVDTAAVYNPATDTWAPMAAMPAGRHHSAAGTDGTRFFVFGGRDGGNPVSLGFADVQIYDPATDTWVSSFDNGSAIAPLPQQRSGMGKAVFFGGEFYVIGGETTAAGSGQVQGNVYNRVDVYNPLTNVWRLEATLPTARHGIFPVAADGKIFVAGGGTVSGASQSTMLEVFSR